MLEKASKKIWTIGHSTRSLSDFIRMLESFHIQLLVDIRAFPGSRKYPHFNKENLQPALEVNSVLYTHMNELGGRRKPEPDSINIAWRNTSFRGYADYMQTPAFQKAIDKLQALASDYSVAYMCSEAPWWKCHRALVSDYLKLNGWSVFHIMEYEKATEHPFTSPARQVQGKLFYQ